MTREKSDTQAINWLEMTAEQIVEHAPDEVKHRLAGMLLHWATFSELPEEVKAASATRRRVYGLSGVLPVTEENAAAVLERWEALRSELCEMVKSSSHPL